LAVAGNGDRAMPARRAGPGATRLWKLP
jgi:hypothetical protein